jgi:hypothetical protein
MKLAGVGSDQKRLHFELLEPFPNLNLPIWTRAYAYGRFSGNSTSIPYRGKGEHRVRPYTKRCLIGADSMFALIRLRFTNKILGSLKAICLSPVI